MSYPHRTASSSTTFLPTLRPSSWPSWLTGFTWTLSHVYNEILRGVMSGGDIINPSGCPGTCHINEVESTPWGAVGERHLITITEHRGPDWETKSSGNMTRRGNKVTWWGVCLQAVTILRKMLGIHWWNFLHGEKYALILYYNRDHPRFLNPYVLGSCTTTGCNSNKLHRSVLQASDHTGCLRACALFSNLQAPFFHSQFQGKLPRFIKDGRHQKNNPPRVFFLFGSVE